MITQNIKFIENQLYKYLLLPKKQKSRIIYGIRIIQKNSIAVQKIILFIGEQPFKKVLRDNFPKYNSLMVGLITMILM